MTTSKRRPRWTAKETEHLHSLVGDYPTHLIVKHYRCWASASKMPYRTPYAIEQKLRKLRISRIPVGTYITSGTLVSLLGVSYTTIDRWVNHGYISSHRSPYADPRALGARSPRRVFLRSDIVQLAIDNPHLLAGTSQENLFLLLEDHELAADIARRYPRRFGRDPVPVICVETGKTYSSITAAARAMYVTKNCIYGAIQKGSCANGFHWRRAVA